MVRKRSSLGLYSVPGYHGGEKKLEIRPPSLMNGETEIKAAEPLPMVT